MAYLTRVYPVSEPSRNMFTDTAQISLPPFRYKTIVSSPATSSSTSSVYSAKEARTLDQHAHIFEPYTTANNVEPSLSVGQISH